MYQYMEDGIYVRREEGENKTPGKAIPSTLNRHLEVYQHLKMSHH
jgi:hypothetical protein